MTETDGAPETPPSGDTDARDTAAILYPNDAPKAPGILPEQKNEPSTDPGSQAPEYKLQMPEGIEVDPDLLSSATPVFRELGLSDEQASKLVPLAQKVQGNLLSEMHAHHVELRTGWARDAKADGSIGGANWDSSVRLASNALTAGGAGPGSEVRKLLNETGLGDHPAFIRLFRNLGLKLGAAVPPRTDAELFYPGQAKR